MKCGPTEPFEPKILLVAQPVKAGATGVDDADVLDVVDEVGGVGSGSTIPVTFVTA